MIYGCVEAVFLHWKFAIISLDSSVWLPIAIWFLPQINFCKFSSVEYLRNVLLVTCINLHNKV